METEVAVEERADGTADDGVLFENETKNDIETGMKASQKLIRRMKYGLGAGGGGLLIALGLMLLLLEIFETDEKDYFFPVFLLVFGVVFLIFCFFFFDKLVRKNADKMLQGKTSTVLYRFRQDTLEIVSHTSDGATDTMRCGYGVFPSCLEYDDMWVLSYNKIAVYALNKNGMRKGSAEELSEFLRAKIAERYQDKRKKK